MLNCWPTKIFQQLIVPGTTFHPNRKLIVISFTLLRMQLSYSSYLVAESTKCLTHKCWKLPTKSSDEKLKIRLLFFAKHVSVRSVLYLKIISRVDYQQLAGEFPLERLLGLKISGWSVLPIRCYLNYHFASCSFFVVFCQLLPPSIEAGYRSSSFFNLTDPKWSLHPVHLHSGAFFWTATWRGTFKIFIGIHTTAVRVFLTTFRHFVFLFASG